MGRCKLCKMLREHDGHAARTGTPSVSRPQYRPIDDDWCAESESGLVGGSVPRGPRQAPIAGFAALTGRRKATTTPEEATRPAGPSTLPARRSESAAPARASLSHQPISVRTLDSHGRDRVRVHRAPRRAPGRREREGQRPLTKRTDPARASHLPRPPQRPPPTPAPAHGAPRPGSWPPPSRPHPTNQPTVPHRPRPPADAPGPDPVARARLPGTARSHASPCRRALYSRPGTAGKVGQSSQQYPSSRRARSPGGRDSFVLLHCPQWPPRRPRRPRPRRRSRPTASRRRATPRSATRACSRATTSTRYGKQEHPPTACPFRAVLAHFRPRALDLGGGLNLTGGT